MADPTWLIRGITNRFIAAHCQPLAVAAATATYLLIVMGALVRASGSGLGCPDWPTCHGQLLPPPDPAAWIEWTHRFLGAATSLLILATCGAVWLSRPAPARRRLAVLVPALLLLEVFLGAVVVWLELPGLAVLVHLTIALAILSVLVWLALPPRASIPPGTMRADGRDRLRPLVLLTGSALCLLLVAGAFVRATAAGWACLGFPDCNGQGLFSLGQSALADLQLAHRGLAYVTSALVLWLLVASWRQGRKRPAVRSASLGLALTMLTRATIGALRVSTGLPPWLQVLHVAGAAAAWNAMVVLARVSAQGGQAHDHRAPRPAQAAS
jgi:heme a synthase